MVLAAFAMGADEFIVAGVVEEIAAALAVTLGAVGQLESAYALGVAIGAPLFTALGTRVPRRRMLLASAGVFVLGNLISALGPTYGAVMAGRLVSAMAHGAFFGIAAVMAADLVDPSRRGSAMATIFAGMSVATILGAPLGAAVGQALGWRYTFWTLVAFGGVAVAALIALLPRGAGARTARDAHAGHEGHGDAALDELDAHARAHMAAAAQSAPIGQQLAALRRPAVWLSLLTTLLGYGGVFTSYVYVAPQLTDVAGFDRVWLTPLLLVFGAGLFVGNYVGGRLADRWPTASVPGTLAALAAALFGMTFAVQSPATAVPGLFLLGAAAFAVVAPLQLRVVNKAGDAPDVASASNISAFTLGSAIGIALGGAAIDGGLGPAAVNWVGGLLTSAGLLLALLGYALVDRAARPAEPAARAAHAHH
jgi:predicted MFS family arabinose efflux permease